MSKTVPVVCSTIIWLAVQKLNQAGYLPRLVLDPRDASPPFNVAPCISSIERHPEWDRRDTANDGLYLYDEPQRREAAQALHDYLEAKVRQEIAKAVPGIVKALGGAIITVSVLITSLSLPLAVLAALLGISLADAETLVEWLSDMPEDVANQIVNAFASDFCAEAAKDSDNWKNPGEGRSVSPDNIMRSWAAPQPGGDPRQALFGLYGYNRAAIVKPPKWAIRPLTAWAVSPGPSAMEGIVTFRGKPVNGARVTVCCDSAMTRDQVLVGGRIKQDGVYRMLPPAGNYLARAQWEDPDTGVMMSVEQPVSLPFMAIAQVDFDLQPPPASDRLVTVSGRMDIVSRVAFGKDWWGHPEWTAKPMHLGPYGRPGTPDEELGVRDSAGTSQDLSDYGSVRVTVNAEWQSDFSVKVSWIAAIFDGDDQKVSHSKENVFIPADGAQGWIVDLATAGPWPDRAHIEFTITNNQQP